MNRTFIVTSVIVTIVLASGLFVSAAPSMQATLPATEVATPDGTKSHPFLNPCTGSPFHTIATGAAVKSAEAGLATYNNNYWVITFALHDNDEAHVFSKFTETHISQPLAIVLDGQVLSAPVIQAALTTGGQIAGNFTKETAQSLAVQLRYGALPIALSVESIDTTDTGLRVVLAPDNPKVTDRDIAGAQQIIEKRLNDLGIVQPSIKSLENHRLQIDMSGVNDPQVVIQTIRETGLLEFVDFSATGSCTASMPAAGQYILTDAQLLRVQMEPTAEATSTN